MKTIIRNTLFMNLFNVFGRGSGLVRYALLVYFLTDPDYALITFGFSVGRLCRHFMDWGLDNFITREGARDPQRIPSYLLHGFIFKIAWGALFFIAAFFYLYGARSLNSSELLVVYLSMGGSALLSLTGVMRSGYGAVERMEYIFYTNAPVRAISLLLLLAALAARLPVAYAAAAVAVEPLLWLVLLAWCAKSAFPLRAAVFSWSAVAFMFRESWALAVYGFFNIFYLSLDVIMIEALMGGREAVGPYTISSLLVEGVTLLLTGYLMAAFPVFSRLYQTDEDAFRRLFRRSVTVLVAMSFPLSVLLCVWAGDWINLIRPANPVSAQVLAILALNLNFALLNTLMILVFTARNRQRWLVGFTALAVVFSFGANWLLIPRYHQVGAAAATLISQGVLFFIMGGVGLRLFALPVPLGRAAGLAAITLTSAAAADCVHGLPVLADALLFGGAWIAQAKAFNVISVDEIRRMARAAQP